MTGADWRAPIAGDEFNPLVDRYLNRNRVIWGEPEQNFNSNNFGLITSQGNSPRQMQFGLKLYW
jgi:hypothetical protein